MAFLVLLEALSPVERAVLVRRRQGAGDREAAGPAVARHAAANLVTVSDLQRYGWAGAVMLPVRTRGSARRGPFAAVFSPPSGRWSWPWCCRGSLVAAGSGLGAAMVVVVRDVLFQDRAQVPLPGDQHPVGDLGPGCSHPALGISVRSRAPRRDLHHLDSGTGQHRVEPGGGGSFLLRWLTGSLQPMSGRPSRARTATVAERARRAAEHARRRPLRRSGHAAVYGLGSDSGDATAAIMPAAVTSAGT